MLLIGRAGQPASQIITHSYPTKFPTLFLFLHKFDFFRLAIVLLLSGKSLNEYFCLQNWIFNSDTVTFHQVLRCLCEVVVKFIQHILSILFTKNLKIKYVAFHRRWQMVVTLMWKAASSAIMVNPPYSSDVSKLSLHHSKCEKKQTRISCKGKNCAWPLLPIISICPP